ncbi:MAG: hypothetical protein JXR90_17110 [Spirochaetes bacterium]|nr:hypothetical protein [Spirochaetota bacterium]
MRILPVEAANIEIHGIHADTVNGEDIEINPDVAFKGLIVQYYKNLWELKYKVSPETTDVNTFSK